MDLIPSLFRLASSAKRIFFLGSSRNMNAAFLLSLPGMPCRLYKNLHWEKWDFSEFSQFLCHFFRTLCSKIER